MKQIKVACVADNSAKAQHAFREIKKRYEVVEISKRRTGAEAIIVLGGDGFMLQTLHTYMKMKLPFYGINCGTVGFLMNEPILDNLDYKIKHARGTILYPLHMYARCLNGKIVQALAFNEVSLFRQGRQASKIRVAIDHVVRLNELICDGVMVSTPAGSTAYNFSAGGPIIPLGANVIALTPLVPFRPRRWGGALLAHDSSVIFSILEPKKRPVAAVADFTEIKDVGEVIVSEQRKSGVTLLFDPEHNLAERIIKEQFTY
ncbi:MAG: NAD kinase [Rickettsiales bacterium]